MIGEHPLNLFHKSYVFLGNVENTILGYRLSPLPSTIGTLLFPRIYIKILCYLGHVYVSFHV